MKNCAICNLTVAYTVDRVKGLTHPPPHKKKYPKETAIHGIVLCVVSSLDVGLTELFSYFSPLISRANQSAFLRCTQNATTAAALSTPPPELPKGSTNLLSVHAHEFPSRYKFSHLNVRINFVNQ